MPLRQELFALSGMMLKTWIMSEIEMVSGRPVARRMEISDQLKQNSRTVFSLEEVSFGVELESEIFTRRWRERKWSTGPRRLRHVSSKPENLGPTAG